MQRLPVESSDIVSIGYDAGEQLLEIEFNGGRVYRYFDVPQRTYDHFLKANSYGGYFNAHINGYYRYRRIDEDVKPKKYDSIAIVTGNSRKVHYLQLACSAFDITVEQLDLPVDKIQGDDPEKIAVHKAKQAYRAAQRPIVIDDKYWHITALRGFPGAYAHDVIKWLKAEDLLAMLGGKKDRSVHITDTLVYCDGKKVKVFTAARHGVITGTPYRQGKSSSLEQITILESAGETIAQMEEEGKPTFTMKSSAWYAFARWYNMQRKLGLV